MQMEYQFTKKILYGCNVTTVEIPLGQSISKADTGTETYITVHSDAPLNELTNIIPVGECLAESLAQVLQPYYGGKLCIFGLGNRNIPAAALGSEVIHNLPLKPLAEKEKDGNFDEVCAFEPGVAANNNIGTKEIVNKIAKAVGADCILLVDSCISKSPSKLFQTIQIFTTKTSKPYSFDHNIDWSTLDIPVICLCIPTIFSSTHIMKGELFTSPTIHDVISAAGSIIAYAILRAIWPSSSKEKCFLFSKMNQGPIQYGSLLSEDL